MVISSGESGPIPITLLAYPSNEISINLSEPAKILIGAIPKTSFCPIRATTAPSGLVTILLIGICSNFTKISEEIRVIL